MPLDAKQLAVLQSHMSSKGIKQCPLCGSNNVAPGEVILPPIAAGGSISMAGGFPMVQVVCNNCFHVMHFAADML